MRYGAGPGGYIEICARVSTDGQTLDAQVIFVLFHLLHSIGISITRLIRTTSAPPDSGRLRCRIRCIPAAVLPAVKNHTEYGDTFLGLGRARFGALLFCG
jgi:hypothetical protein